MKKIRLAFAGLRHGHIWALHQAVLDKSDVFEVAGAWETFPESLVTAKEHGLDVRYKNFEELIADPDVDAVAIGDYYGARGKEAIAALKAGKHVISDKPLCTTLDELKIIRTLAKEKDLAVGIMLDLRDNANFTAALSLVKEGAVGKVNNIMFGAQHPLMYGTRPMWYFEEGKHGGVINDIAIHGIDLARILTGSDVKTVNGARCWNFYAKEVPAFKDSAQFMVEMADGAGVMADVSYAAPNSCGFGMPSYWRFQICGDKGTVVFDYASDGVMLYKDGNADGQKIEKKAPECTYLDCFAADVSGEKRYTDGYLDATEQTLTIQRYADAQ